MMMAATESEPLLSSSTPSTTTTTTTIHASTDPRQNVKASHLAIPIPTPTTAVGGTAADASGLSLTWSDVTQTYTARQWTLLGCSQRRVPVLKNVSGRCLTGETLAIMGPSGAGKTSLLNLLAGRAQLQHGNVFVNGHKVTSAVLRQLSVYVMQDDILLSVLTPREAILFSARLRLPQSMSLAEKIKRTDRLLDQLGLTGCCDTYIRNISGGERKRTSIGVELVSEPKVLFLDEPTSGLDATASLAVMRIVTNLATVEGRTVITTIHQRLLLMANGRVAYDGEAKVAAEYFNAAGYRIPENYNPADHFMGVLSLMDEKDTRTSADIEALLDRWQQMQTEGPASIAYGTTTTTTTGTDDTHHERSVNSLSGDDRPFVLAPAKHASLCEQLNLLSVRALKIYMRDPLRFIVACAQTLLISMIMMLVYMNIGDDLQSIMDRAGFFFFAVSSFVFVSSIALVLSMPNERSVFLREQDNKMYSSVLYYFAKVFSEVPLQIFFPLLFTLLVYWAIGLNYIDQAKPVIFWITIALLNLNGQGVGMLIGVSVPDAITAMTVVPVYVIPTMLFSGFFKELSTLPSWLVWISALSPYKWGLNMLLVNEFTDLPLQCGETPFPGDFCPVTSGDQYLAFKGLTYEDLYISAVALCLLTALSHLLAIISLYSTLLVRRHSNVRS